MTSPQQILSSSILTTDSDERYSDESDVNSLLSDFSVMHCDEEFILLLERMRGLDRQMKELKRLYIYQNSQIIDLLQGIYQKINNIESRMEENQEK